MNQSQAPGLAMLAALGPFLPLSNSYSWIMPRDRCWATYASVWFGGSEENSSPLPKVFRHSFRKGQIFPSMRDRGLTSK